MPLDVLGRTRATLKHSTSPPRPTGLGNLLKLLRDGDRLLQLLIFNEEFLVSACHQRALITSLPFVHTARRSYRLNDPVSFLDSGAGCGSPLWRCGKMRKPYHLEEGEVVTRFP